MARFGAVFDASLRLLRLRVLRGHESRSSLGIRSQEWSCAVAYVLLFGNFLYFAKTEQQNICLKVRVTECDLTDHVKIDHIKRKAIMLTNQTPIENHLLIGVNPVTDWHE